MVRVKELAAGYAGNPVIQDISFSVNRAAITAIIGPNGSGKSTLAKCIARQIKPIKGAIKVDGKHAHEYSLREYARKISFLGQTKGVASISVRELVAHGRYPHLAFPYKLAQNDFDLVQHAMDRVGVSAFASRMLSALSGGERQRAYIAMALAQEAQLLILDEPTTYLDISCQLSLLDLLISLRNEGKTIIVILHDLNQALQTADQVCLMDKGKLISVNSPAQVALSNDIDRVFQIKTQTILVHEKPWLVMKKKR